MKARKGWIAVTAAGWLWSMTAGAATYYVAQEDPKASDENPGTEAGPWMTIGRSVKAVLPGDTVYVKRGVYREEVGVRATPWNWNGRTFEALRRVSTNSAETISFVSAPRGAAVIRGSDPVQGWQLYTNAIWVHNDWPVNSQQVFCDGRSLQQIGGTNAVIHMPRYNLYDLWQGRKGDGLKDMEAGSFCYDLPGQRLYVWLADGGDPNRRLIEASVRCFWFGIAADFVRVSGFVMEHANTSAKVNWAAANVSGAFDILEDCDIRWGDFNGLSIGGRNNTILNCRVNHHGDTGIVGGGWGHRIINCETSFNNYRHWSVGWGAGGVKMIPHAQDILVSGHVAVSNEGDGIWFDWGNFNITIQNSVCHHNKGSGIFYEVSERATIKNNVCYENGGRGIYLSNSSDCDVLHNVLYRNGMSGVASSGMVRQGPPFGDAKDHILPGRNNLIWGNIFMDNCHPDLCPKEPDGRDKPWSTRPELILPEEAARNYGNVSDYNVFFRSGGRAIPFWKGWHTTLFKDLAEWQKASGNDTHSIIAEPQFADLKNRDFHPATNSPAIGLVLPQMGGNYDGDGRLRVDLKAQGLDRFTAGPFESEYKP